MWRQWKTPHKHYFVSATEGTVHGTIWTKWERFEIVRRRFCRSDRFDFDAKPVEEQKLCSIIFHQVLHWSVCRKMVSRRKSIFEDCHDRKLSSFPDSHPLILSHSELPASCTLSTTASCIGNQRHWHNVFFFTDQVMEDSAQAYGFTLTPFIKNDSYT